MSKFPRLKALDVRIRRGGARTERKIVQCPKCIFAKWTDEHGLKYIRVIPTTEGERHEQK